MDGVMELLTQERHHVTTIGIKTHMELCMCSIEVFMCVYSLLYTGVDIVSLHTHCVAIIIATVAGYGCYHTIFYKYSYIHS